MPVSYDLALTFNSGLIPATVAAPRVAAVSALADALNAYGIEVISDNTAVANGDVTRTLRLTFTAFGEQNFPTASQQMGLIGNLYRSSFAGGSWTKYVEQTITPV